MKRSSREMGAADRLRLFTQRSNATHSEYLNDPRIFRQYQRFVRWQSRYMSAYYEDFRESKGYAAAVDFVVSDLTGIGISGRDRQLTRVVPLMTKMLPYNALQTLAVAMELNSRILAINLSICRELFGNTMPDYEICERNYCLACRRASGLEEFLELAALTKQVGENLNHLVQIPLIGTILRAMRSPARLAGFGRLQEFLETGYRTFKAIEDVNQFLAEISTRTTEVFTRIHNESLVNLKHN